MSDHLTAHERVAPMREERSGPLSDVRVLDLTSAIAGPWCSMMLADLGADVVKVEPPAGDPQRWLGPFTREDQERRIGAAFGSYNRNKRGITLDLASEEGREALFGLVETADALVENMRTGVMDRLGLGYEVLRERNPQLVYAAIRCFGDPRSGESPHAEWPAYDVIAQSMGGLVSMNGADADHQVKVGPFIGDIYPGTVGALAVTAAIHHARRTGEGQFVDVAMTDAVMALCEMGVTRHSVLGWATPPSGNRSDVVVPFDIYATKDGAAAIGAPQDHHFRLLVRMMGREDLADDERTSTARGRLKNRHLIDGPIAEWVAQHTTAEIVELLGGVVPVGPVNQPADLFESEHVAARDMLVAVDQPSGRPVVQVNTPMRFSATPTGIYRRAPVLDEHHDEILAEADDLRSGVNRRAAAPEG
jgi:crotonobetainyl-CoA:carnitine CoA-transferase CaiB-like acyl-CoA transferase